MLLHIELLPPLPPGSLGRVPCPECPLVVVVNFRVLEPGSCAKENSDHCFCCYTLGDRIAEVASRSSGHRKGIGAATPGGRTWPMGLQLLKLIPLHFHLLNDFDKEIPSTHKISRPWDSGATFPWELPLSLQTRQGAFHTCVLRSSMPGSSQAQPGNPWDPQPPGRSPRSLGREEKRPAGSVLFCSALSLRKAAFPFCCMHGHLSGCLVWGCTKEKVSWPLWKSIRVRVPKAQGAPPQTFFILLFFF